MEALEEERRLDAVDRIHRILLELSDEEVLKVLFLDEEIITRLDTEFDFERCLETALGGRAAWSRASEAERYEVSCEVFLDAFPTERRRRIVNEFCKARDMREQKLS